ncbi:MAG: transcription termination/antitermination protein NusG [Synergistes sp.]|nr:transcription termination/antitermination protein NusG [Synergistes sp.]
MGDLFGNTQERRWYIVQTYSGYEKRVKADIEKRIPNMNMDGRIFNVLVPEEDREIKKDGKSKHIKRRIFPCYVLVEMILDEGSWHVVRHTPGVTGFVGSGNHPIPLTPKEANDILAKVGKDARPKVEVEFEIGDMVQVKNGPFAGQSGPVVAIDIDKAKIKFRGTLFGREQDIETDYTDLEKI